MSSMAGQYVVLSVLANDTTQAVYGYTNPAWKFADAVIDIIQVTGSHGVFLGDSTSVGAATQGSIVGSCPIRSAGTVSVNTPIAGFDPSTLFVKAQTNGETLYVTVSGVLA